MSDTDISNTIRRVLLREFVSTALHQATTYYYYLSLTQLEQQMYKLSYHNVLIAIDLFHKSYADTTDLQHINYICNCRLIGIISLLHINYIKPENTTVIDLSNSTINANHNDIMNGQETNMAVEKLFFDSIHDIEKLSLRQQSNFHRTDIWLYISNLLLHQYNIDTCTNLLNSIDNMDSIDVMLYRIVLYICSINTIDLNQLLSLCHKILQYTQSIQTQLLYCTVLILIGDAYHDVISNCKELLRLLSADDTLNNIQILHILAISYHKTMQYDNATRVYSQLMMLLNKYNVPLSNTLSISIHYNYSQYLIQLSLIESNETDVRDLLTAAKSTLSKLFSIVNNSIGINTLFLECIKLRCINHDHKYSSNELNDYFTLATTVYSQIQRLQSSDMYVYYIYCCIGYITQQYNSVIECCDFVSTLNIRHTDTDDTVEPYHHQLQQMKLHSYKMLLLNQSKQ